MLFHKTTLRDAWLLQIEPIHDRRGFFVRTFCAQEFGKRGLEIGYPQHSVSRTLLRGSLRGLHYQRDPHGEAKLVRCLRGAVWDVIVDIRPNSPTYRSWENFELSSANGRQLYVPKGFAHGFQTLSDDAEVSYLISQSYEPSAASGIRYDDPAFAITWPLPVTEISEKDLSWPDYAETKTPAEIL